VSESPFDAFKWTVLEEARGGTWVQEAFLDTPNWFADATEAERVELAARALRELYADGYLAFRRPSVRGELSVEEVRHVLSHGGWRRGESDAVEYDQTPKGRRWFDDLHERLDSA
jgi:hypothetical protein